MNVVDLELIAEKSRSAEIAYYDASRANSPERMKKLEIADAWASAVHYAIMLSAALARAELAERESGIPTDGAGFPDVQAHTNSIETTEDA